MNLEGIKSALAKLPKWVKANPKKAAVIAVTIVIVAYFAIKRGATATGEGSADSATLDSAGGGLGSLESSGGGGSISTGGGSTGGAPGESITTTTTTDSGGGGYAGNMDSFGIGSGADSFAYTAPAFGGSTASIMATASRGLSDVKKTAAPVTTPAPKKNDTLAAGLVSSLKVTTPAPVAAKVSNTLSPARAVAKSAPAKTAAELAGLPKFFTGVSGGRRYAAGVFVGNVATATTRRAEKV